MQDGILTFLESKSRRKPSWPITSVPISNFALRFSTKCASMRMHAALSGPRKKVSNDTNADDRCREPIPATGTSVHFCNGRSRDLASSASMMVITQPVSRQATSNFCWLVRPTTVDADRQALYAMPGWAMRGLSDFMIGKSGVSDPPQWDDYRWHLGYDVPHTCPYFGMKWATGQTQSTLSVEASGKSMKVSGVGAIPSPSSSSKDASGLRVGLDCTGIPVCLIYLTSAVINPKLYRCTVKGAANTDEPLVPRNTRLHHQHRDARDQGKSQHDLKSRHKVYHVFTRLVGVSVKEWITREKTSAISRINQGIRGNSSIDIIAIGLTLRPSRHFIFMRSFSARFWGDRKSVV